MFLVIPRPVMDPQHSAIAFLFSFCFSPLQVTAGVIDHIKHKRPREMKTKEQSERALRKLTSVEYVSDLVILLQINCHIREFQF